MIRPAVGAIFSEERRPLNASNGRILFCLPTPTGAAFPFSKSPQYHGVEAAQKVFEANFTLPSKANTPLKATLFSVTFPQQAATLH